MISFNNSDWLIPITQCYFCTIYIWAYNSGMQIEDLAPFTASSSQYFGLNDHSFLDAWLLHCSGGSINSKILPCLEQDTPTCYLGFFRKLCENENGLGGGACLRVPPRIRHCIERSVPITGFTAFQPPISCIFQIGSFHCHWSSHCRILRFTTRRRALCRRRRTWRFFCCTGCASTPRRGRTSAPCTC